MRRGEGANLNSQTKLPQCKTMVMEILSMTAMTPKTPRLRRPRTGEIGTLWA